MTTFRQIATILCMASLPLAVCGQQRKSTTSGAVAQTSTKAIFSNYPPYLCVGGGFVAMAGIGRSDLVVIPIDVNGIEVPHTIRLAGDEVRGIQCSASHIELLVYDYKSDRFIMPLYTVEWHSQSLTTINEEKPEDLNLPKSGPTPPAVKHRTDSLGWGGNRAAGYTKGDWYVWIPLVVDRPNNTYEVHFVSTNTGGVAKLIVTLLEETLDRKKTTKSVPLVHIEAVEVND
jgi:hypothetical protein